MGNQKAKLYVITLFICLTLTLLLPFFSTIGTGSKLVQLAIAQEATKTIKIMSCDPIPANIVPGNPHWDIYRRLVNKVAWPGTKMDYCGLAKSYYSYPAGAWRILVNDVGIAEECYLAEKRGYDAFLINCVLDGHLKACRSLVNIPVVAPTESAILLALTQGHKFSIIVTNPPDIAEHEHKVKEYGFADRLASVRCPPEFKKENYFMMQFQDPKRFCNIVRAEMEKAVLEDRAETVWFACTIGCSILTENGITEVNGSQVINPVAAAIKRGETLVSLKRSLGLSVSRNSVYASPPPGWEKERAIQE